jgi:hypothetical protein
MHRHLIDRWYDTTAFGIALGLSGALVLPVLALGVMVTVIGGSVTLAQSLPVELWQVVIALLAVGGTLGFVGYLRAHWGLKDPGRHNNVTVTLLFLVAGVLAALAVAGVALVTAVEIWRRENSDGGFFLALGASFAAANLVWAFAGIARMQRLMRRYEERAGRAFDSLPAVLLFTAIVLVIAATLKTITL